MPCVRIGRYLLVVALLLIAATAVDGTAAIVHAQAAPALFAPSARPGRLVRQDVRAQRSRPARARLEALASRTLELNLFDDVRLTATLSRAERTRRGDGRIWRGRLADRPGVVTLVEVGGALSGTVFLEHTAFEIVTDGGEVAIRELQPASFPSDDPLDASAAFDRPAPSSTSTGSTSIAADGTTLIDVMVVWTPNARAATGGTEAGIRSLVELAVANANTTYTNSLVPVQLRLVYSGEVAFTENTGNIQGDLSALAGKTDGRGDNVHALREQYAADIVSLVGSGYTSGSGACGMGYLMGSPSTSFASEAFNVVDQACAAGNLTFAHEVGHNQGLHHDPPSAIGYGTPSYSYAYGYQDPGGAFRTVLSYGGAVRIPYLSSPAVSYGGRVTGTSSQDNARALRGTAGTVSAFRGGTTAPPPPPPPPSGACTYSITPASMSYEVSGGSATIVVTTTTGCAWTASSQATWIGASGSGSGSGSIVVSVASNSGGARSGRATVAGQTVSVSQKGVAKVRGPKR